MRAVNARNACRNADARASAAVASFMLSHPRMTSKRRSQRLSKIKRSFVVTFSAMAAGATGCATHETIGNPPPSSERSGGEGGAAGEGASGGAGGTGGDGGFAGAAGVGGTNPPSTLVACPADLPSAGEACDGPIEEDKPCVYIDSNEPACSPLGAPRHATCAQGQWVIQAQPLGCNPPPPDINPGFADYDGGAEDDDAGR